MDIYCMVPCRSTCSGTVRCFCAPGYSGPGIGPLGCQPGGHQLPGPLPDQVNHLPPLSHFKENDWKWEMVCHDYLVPELSQANNGSKLGSLELKMSKWWINMLKILNMYSLSLENNQCYLLKSYKNDRFYWILKQHWFRFNSSNIFHDRLPLMLTLPGLGGGGAILPPTLWEALKQKLF